LSAYALASFEGKLYLFGGWDGQKYSDSVYSYDPEQDQWDELPPMPDALAYLSAVELGGNIYLVGGYDGNTSSMTNTQFSPEAVSLGESPWLERKPLPQARYKMVIANMADMIFLIGGEVGEKEKQAPTLVYNAVFDSWQAYDEPLFYDLLQPGVTSIGPRFYVFGGQQEGSPTNQLVAYQPFFTVMLPIVR
jgi:N-acetylneuraminic acid mutarotase